MRWLKGAKFKDLTQSYVRYVRCHCNTATSVFDGYNNGTSMESNEHARIAINKCQIAVVNEKNLSFYPKKFICNKNNKASIITLISKYFDNQRVIKCNRDADKTVVSEALSLTSPVGGQC